MAQHADDNPVVSAEDAFGLRLGLESIGIYSAGSVRGFSPQAAGNVRIDGLYFDQQGVLSDRVLENSTIRVGINAIGYAFPAPTGIVDYELRRANNVQPGATMIVDGGPFKTRSVSLDGDVPLVTGAIHLPMGGNYQISSAVLGGSYPGYSQRILNFGFSPQWTVNDHLVFRSFLDWEKISHAQTMPIVLTQGDFLPPEIPHRYLGQNWAEGESIAENFGGIVHAGLNKIWSFSAGIFRSIADNPVSFTDLYENTTPSGLADHILVGNPNQRAASTSGEAHLSGRFLWGDVSHDVVFLARGRNASALYGGSDSVDKGQSAIDVDRQVAEPDFHFSQRVLDRNRLLSSGIAYHAQWSHRGEFAAGIQRENYEKWVTTPGEPTFHLRDSPWRYYGTFAVSLTDSAAAYMGYTQGLEDSGVAPDSASNRGAVLPASRTWQTDAGLRYKISEHLQFIGGVFEITKPYFNLDADNVDRELGQQRARDVEMSFSGEAIQNLNVIAGAVIGRVEVIGPALAAEGVGRMAFGQPHVWAVFNANYKLPFAPTFSIDYGVTYFGQAPASVDNVVRAPSITQQSVGGRYRFDISGTPAALRLQITNIENVHVWNIFGSPGYFQWAPRSFTAYVTVDI